MMQEDQKGWKKNNIRAEQTTDNCCTDETTRRRGRRYRQRAGGEGKIREQREKHDNQNKTTKQDK